MTDLGQQIDQQELRRQLEELLPEGMRLEDLRVEDLPTERSLERIRSKKLPRAFQKNLRDAETVRQSIEQFIQGNDLPRFFSRTDCLIVYE